MIQIVCVKQDSFRLWQIFELLVSIRVKRDADTLMEWFGGHSRAPRSSPCGRPRDG